MKYIVIERYADNGEFSHYDLINTENGETAITDIDETLQLRQCAVSGLLPDETSLKWINDDWCPCDVTECCGIGPITNENYCPKCGKKIKRQ